MGGRAPVCRRGAMGGGHGSNPMFAAQLGLLGGVVASQSFVPDAEKVYVTHLVQSTVLVFGLICTTYWVSKVNQPTPVQRALEQDTVMVASKTAGGQALGLNGEWHAAMQRGFERVQSVVGSGAALAFLLGAALAFPLSLLDGCAVVTNAAWERALAWPVGDDLRFALLILISHMAMFWPMSIASFLMDYYHPASLKGYKNQENERISPEKYRKVFAVAVMNQGVTFTVCWGIGRFVFPYTSPQGMGRELPSAPRVIMEVLAGSVFSEIWFYFGHRAMHESQWLWDNVHSWHHSIKAPSCMASIFAHPLEHLTVSLPTIALGPLACGSHAVSMCAFAFFSTMQVCFGHSGWHFPLFPPNEFHDYHHSNGYENYGTNGLLDIIFNTQKTYLLSWEKQCEKTYWNVLYPCDKVLLRRVGPDDKEAAATKM